MTAYWSCLSKSTSAGADLIYDDDVATHYSYDSTVINHKLVSLGDVLIIRDAHLIYGFAVVTSISSAPATKVMQRCPHCGSTKWTHRKTVTPAYRCSSKACNAVFHSPVANPKEVTSYTASYGDRWYELVNPLPVRTLHSVYAGADRQNAIRRLDDAACLELILSNTGFEAQLQIELLQYDAIPSGHLDAVVRRRVGQQQFRHSLLARYGSTCAVTGPQPEPVLDAAHLYSYAAVGKHSADAGLLLRTDIHRLFDRLLITVDTRSWHSQVAPKLLAQHPHLAVLDHVPLHIPSDTHPSEELLAAHRTDSLERWKSL